MGGDAAFQAFIRDFEATAVAAGITPETYNRAMAGVTPIPAIAAGDRQPAGIRQADLELSRRRGLGAAGGRCQGDAGALRRRAGRIETSSGVPKEILVAIWGMETDYGGSTGGYNLFASLATQSYRRAAPAICAARIAGGAEDHAAAKLSAVAKWCRPGRGRSARRSSCPRTFFKYATDGDGDGRIDLWTSPADALASTAALFSQ